MRKVLLLVSSFFLLYNCSSNSFNEKPLFDTKYIPAKTDNQYIYLDLSAGKKAKGSADFDYASLFYDGVAIVQNEDQWYFINPNFKLISTESYDNVSIFHDDVAYAVKPRSSISAINKSGRVIFTLDNAEYAYRFNDGVSVFVSEDDKYGLVNKKGKILIEPQNYCDLGPFGYNGMIVAAISTDSGKRYGVISYENDTIIPFEYVDILLNEITARNKVFIVNSGDGYGVINTKNEEIIPTEYDELVAQPDKNFLFRKNYKSKGERYGWINSKGVEIIPPTYSDAKPIIWGDLALVKDASDDKYGFINRKGDWIINPRFGYADVFNHNGLAIVQNRAGDDCLINKSGEYVTKSQYDGLYYLGQGLYLTVDDDKQGIINSKDEPVIRMSDIYDFSPIIYGHKFSKVISKSININKVVDMMMEDIQIIKTDNLSLSQLEKKFKVRLNSFKDKTLYSTANKYYSMKITAVVGGYSEESFYSGTNWHYFLSSISIHIDLSDKAESSETAIYEELAKRIGINDNQSQDQTILPECVVSFDYQGNITFRAPLPDGLDI